MSDEGQLADLELWTQEQLLAFVDAVFRTIQERLVDPPVEPRGILSRLEHHCARLLREQNEIANHDAQITAARHEFMREALVAVGNDVLAVKATVAELAKQVDARLASIDSRLYAIESKDRSLTGLVELQRRVSALEKKDGDGQDP